MSSAAREDVLDDLQRSTEALSAAEALVGLGLCADAVSRAYYGAFHALRALLRSRGVEPKSHTGAIHLYNTELVRAGVMPAAHNRLLAGLQRSRELADYDAAVRFDADAAKAEIANARVFAADARAVLIREGWIDA